MMETDTSFTEVDLKPEKFEELREEVEKFFCMLCDKKMVHKIALVLLEGLSTACVDNTTGDIFRSPGTVASDIRKEMLEFLTVRCQSFIAETLILGGRPEEELDDQPSDIISDMIEDFTGHKRNLLTKVSGWMLSELREDRIDDFVQEMELNSFWLLDRRENIARNLLMVVDCKNEYHCTLKFKSEAEIEQHRLLCGFRTLLCENEGCTATYSAANAEKHDSICPFKMLPCEQKCSEILIRQEMDKHCITHFSDDVRPHLRLALIYLNKGASAENLRSRAERIEQEFVDRLLGIQSVRSFTDAVKDLDSKLEPLKVEKNHQLIADDAMKSLSKNHLAENTKSSTSEDSADKNTVKPES